jgi:DNA-binding NarL/FixJ family response regulator
MHSVLIVDDNSNIRKIIHALVEHAGACVVCGEAVDGKQGVEHALRLRPDLVIMDMQMPVMNGFDASRRMRFDSPHVKILMISVENSSHHSRAAEASGAQGFLAKSKVGEHLDTAISTLFENRTYFSHCN